MVIQIILHLMQAVRLVKNCRHYGWILEGMVTQEWTLHVQLIPHTLEVYSLEGMIIYSLATH